MNTRTLIKSAMLAALAAAPLFAATAQTASAQQVVAATCPSGYVLSGSSCIRPAAPTPTCPDGFVFSKGQCIKGRMEVASAVKQVSNGRWAFITREAFGVRKAAELDGANFCAVAGSPADAAADFFKDNGLNATHVKVADDRAGMETYQKYDCDVLVVADKVAVSTADSLKPKGDHIVLPEKLEGPEVASTAPVAAPVQPVAKPVVKAVPKAPTKPKTTVKKKPAPKKVAKKPVRRKPRCSRIRYAYSSGGTCACAGPRVFTGNACVRPRWR